MSLTNQAGGAGGFLAERGRSPSAAPAARQKDLVFSGAGPPGDPLRAGTARAPGAAARTVWQKHHPGFFGLLRATPALAWRRTCYFLGGREQSLWWQQR